MKARITTLGAAAVFAVATAVVAQSQPEVQPEERSAPRAQPTGEQPEIQTRTAAPSNRQGELPSSTTYTNPPAPPAAAQAPPAAEVEMPQPAPPPAPVTAETTTTTTEYEELPGSASPYPSLTLGGLAMIAAGIVVRRKR
ncbi:MAG TPA: hypothetical protein VFW15_07600 [Thermoanaerobaculia bacterium]|nr:hypothetical protein [Thermoanaerobaculia bacterium]